MRLTLFFAVVTIFSFNMLAAIGKAGYPLGQQLETGNTYEATLEKCVDGDTAHFKINNRIYKTRFLYIDTPESTNSIEPFGAEASEFTCSFLHGGTITLETDGTELFDKYERLLAWVWVGQQLHQEEITKVGLVEDFYDYGDYRYEDKIIKAMEYAQRNSVGLYHNSYKKQDNISSFIKIGLGLLLGLTVFHLFRKIY